MRTATALVPRLSLMVVALLAARCSSGGGGDPAAMQQDDTGGTTGEGGSTGGAGTGGSSGSMGGTTTAGSGGSAGGLGGSTPTPDAAVPLAGSGGKAGGMAGMAGMAMAGKGGSAGAVGGAAGIAPDPACGGFLICDGFESYVTGKPPNGPWNDVRQQGATVAIDESKFFTGKKSVKVTIPGADGSTGMFGRLDKGFFPNPDHLYARMMVWLDNTPSGGGHWAWMQTQGGLKTETNGKSNFGVYGTGGHPSTLQSIMIADSPTNPLAADCWAYSNRPVPTKKWACVEWHLDPATNSQEVWVDGQGVPELTFTNEPSGSHGCLGDGVTGNKWPIPTLTAIRFGWIHYHALSANTMWVDDIVVDKKRIGCPK